MLTSGNYGPPGEFPMFPNQAHSHTQISHVPVSARPLLIIVYPLHLGLLCELVAVAAWPVSDPILG